MKKRETDDLFPPQMNDRQIGQRSATSPVPNPCLLHVCPVTNQRMFTSLGCGDLASVSFRRRKVTLGHKTHIDRTT